MTRAQRKVRWSRHVEGWKKSGLTQRGYCEREGISYDTFKRWRRGLRGDGAIRGSVPRLVPVRVAALPVPRSMATDAGLTTGAAARCAGAQIRLSNGRAIALGSEIDEVELGRLIRLLEVLPC
jgi:hypothetical protein